MFLIEYPQTHVPQNPVVLDELPKPLIVEGLHYDCECLRGDLRGGDLGSTSGAAKWWVVNLLLRAASIRASEGQIYSIL